MIEASEVRCDRFEKVEARNDGVEIYQGETGVFVHVIPDDYGPALRAFDGEGAPVRLLEDGVELSDEELEVVIWEALERNDEALQVLTDVFPDPQL